MFHRSISDGKKGGGGGRYELEKIGKLKQNFKNIWIVATHT